ncbi:hypothetical protein N9424_02330 [Gammaproteobacteria bacterium]|nr:hypothetical protein [Gammaproteobacteria bacterium]
MLKLIRNTTLVVTPILFFYDRNLPIEYLFSVDNRFFLFYWLFIPMLIWFFFDNKITVSISGRNKNNSIKKYHSSEEFLTEGPGLWINIISFLIVPIGFSVFMLITDGMSLNVVIAFIVGFLIYGGIYGILEWIAKIYYD